ncbi:hypothetical protein VNI00_010522 [Paramarasmius palmivorus]|uniref:F-box domain-containing protein n=1 Tax=Paramarasmius palmivorus TaxID=297713 RepID=A0AAW0CIT5_9AGAR
MTLATSESLISRFPQETLDTILGTPGLEQEDLKSCSLVQRRWRLESQKQLFRTLHVSIKSERIHELPEEFCRHVRCLVLDSLWSYDIKRIKALLRLAALMLTRLPHLNTLAIANASLAFESRRSWNKFLSALSVTDAPSLKGLILDSVVIDYMYSFHELLSQSRFRDLEELFLRDTCFYTADVDALHDIDGYGRNAPGIYNPWPAHFTSLKSLAVLQSEHPYDIYAALCDERCPCDISGVQRLQFVFSNDSSRELSFPNPNGVFGSLTHLRTRDNQIVFPSSTIPALPLLTHYCIMLILVDIHDDFPEIFDLDFEGLHANAPNLQYIILDLREVYEHGNALTALRNGLDDIILCAPLPVSVRFVVLAPRDKIDEVREVVPRSKATRLLEVIDARDYFQAHTQFQAQRFNPWRCMPIRNVYDIDDNHYVY